MKVRPGVRAEPTRGDWEYHSEPNEALVLDQKAPVKNKKHDAHSFLQGTGLIGSVGRSVVSDLEIK